MTIVMTAIGERVAASLDASQSKSSPWTTSSPSNVRIGERLRRIRESHGISDKEFGEKIGISCEDLHQYESGERRIGAGILLRTAKLLDFRPEYFFQADAKKGVLR
jgi:DNA-binding transcriptional regulator YiaG